MLPISKLISYFRRIIPLTKEDKEVITNRVIEKKIKRKQCILQNTDICKHYTFVVSGLFRMYGVDKNGIEHNIQFAAEGEWIMDISSFHSGKVSNLYIEAIEPSVILQIDKPTLVYLYQNHQKFGMIFRVTIENKFIELQNRVLQNISANAEERYLKFLNEYPHLAHKLPGIQIASYLGITPEFLSAIKKNLSKK